MKLRRSGPVLGAVSLALTPMPAVAGCAACSCSVSATSLSFGTYNPTATTPTQASSNVTINCFSLLILMFGTIDIGLSAGTSGTATQRTLANGTARLNYNVYGDTARSTIWGGLGSGGTLETVSINGLLSYTRAVPAYGSIPAGQWVQPGTYSDSLVVTIVF